MDDLLPPLYGAHSNSSPSNDAKSDPSYSSSYSSTRDLRLGTRLAEPPKRSDSLSPSESSLKTPDISESLPEACGMVVEAVALASLQQRINRLEESRQDHERCTHEVTCGVYVSKLDPGGRFVLDTL